MELLLPFLEIQQLIQLGKNRLITYRQELMMKLLFENWREYLNEDKGALSFDELDAEIGPIMDEWPPMDQVGPRFDELLRNYNRVDDEGNIVPWTADEYSEELQLRSKAARDEIEAEVPDWEEDITEPDPNELLKALELGLPPGAVVTAKKD